jgi:hypothetical protein
MRSPIRQQRWFVSGTRTRPVAGAVLAAVAVLAFAAPAGAALAPPSVPASIAVPPGNVLYLVGHARGYQIYTCQAQGSGFAWVLQAPWAGLFDDSGNPIARHYAGPSWTAADNSTVVGARVGSANAPNEGAIPWLLLQATSTSGPAGGTFTQTTYIQRINTTGGVAPSTGCDAAHVGATAAVPYTADYYFYRAG